MKIQGIGVEGTGMPFSSHQSSCSNRKPKNFEWTDDDAEIQVWMDMAIPSAISISIPQGKKRYGWFCESRAIVPLLRSAFEQEDIFNDIINSYDAIFTCEETLVEKHDKIHFCFAGSNLPWVDRYLPAGIEKPKLLSFICSNKSMCEGHRLRHQLHEKIKTSTNRDVPIDVFGGITGKFFGVSPGCHIKGGEKTWHDKSEALNDYMFSIVMENDVYDTYFTEKLTDCFATGTVPIYYGSKSVGEYFNKDGIIFLDGDVNTMYNKIQNITPIMYHNRMDAIRDNMERVRNMQLADDVLYDKIKELE